MLRFAVKRILLAIRTTTFFVFFWMPNDPAQVMCSKNCDPRTLAAINKGLGIDKPIMEQYWEFHKGLVVGRTFERVGEADSVCPAPCLAYSFRTNEPVLDIIERAFP